MSIKKKINFIFFYSFYRPGPGPAPLREKIPRRLGFSPERSIKNPAVVFGGDSWERGGGFFTIVMF